METNITNFITNPDESNPITIHNIGEAPLHLSSVTLRKGERITLRQTKRGLKRLIPSGTFPPVYK